MAYLKFLCRPRSEKVVKKSEGTFGKVDPLTIDGVFGGWKKATETLVADCAANFPANGLWKAAQQLLATESAAPDNAES